MNITIRMQTVVGLYLPHIIEAKYTKNRHAPQALPRLTR